MEYYGISRNLKDGTGNLWITRNYGKTLMTAQVMEDHEISAYYQYIVHRVRKPLEYPKS